MQDDCHKGTDSPAVSIFNIWWCMFFLGGRFNGPVRSFSKRVSSFETAPIQALKASILAWQLSYIQIHSKCAECLPSFVCRGFAPPPVTATEQRRSHYNHYNCHNYLKSNHDHVCDSGLASERLRLGKFLGSAFLLSASPQTVCRGSWLGDVVEVKMGVVGTLFLCIGSMKGNCVCFAGWLNKRTWFRCASAFLP